MSLSAAPPRTPDLSGRALNDRYELHALIGEGAFGRVYRGRDRRLARSVAVKVIKPWWTEQPDWVRRFEREAQLMASVNDPGIVQIFDVGYADEGLYYVAELVEGESVAARLGRGPLAPWEGRDVAEQLCRALAPAHARRVVHRDIKPANILIGSHGRVKVADFGVARLLGGNDNLAATVVGTPSYMAPEQARGRRITPATDVYSIGVVLYEMLAGCPPFTGASAVDLALCHLQDPLPPMPPTIPDALGKIVERALAKEPDHRYRDGGEMADALARTRESLPTPAASAGGTGFPGANTHGAPRGRGEGARRGPGGGAPRGPAGTLIAPLASPGNDAEPGRRRGTKAVFMAAALLLLGLVFGAILIGSTRQVRVPDVRGLTRAEIGARLRHAHLRLGLRSRYSAKRANTAVQQSPAPGARVAEGSRVVAVLSAGPPPVPVPRIVGFSSGDARRSLGQLGLIATIHDVPAPGIAAGTVTGQTPSAGVKLRPGATVSLSVAETPRWRTTYTFSDRIGRASAPFRIRGTRWRIVYRMSYDGVCTFIFFCSGPTAHVTSAGGATGLGTFSLNAGSDQLHSFDSGPGVYQIMVAPGDDPAHWSVQVQDYY
ncbi:MAG: protein kinase [Solirubrobacterales bacterium]|nr:protein kinase [Solirubrobacterales bacterium]